MNVGSLFAGIGGFDLAARWMGWETRWFSEIDPYASALLAKHWPGVPNHGDITKIDFSIVESVDLLCGGFPCQDISNAGKRAGIDGSRSGLWGEFARAIRELRPRYVVVENVAALLTRGMDVVLGDLAAMGYDAEWQVLLASELGAPHLRARVWIVAYPKGQCGELWASPAEQPWRPASCGDTVADPLRLREPQPEGGQSDQWGRASDSSGEMADPDAERRDGRTGDQRSGRRGESPDGCWWTTEPDVGRVAHGVPARVDRLRGLGNAIVPQCAYVIFQAIQEAEERMRAA